MGERLAAWLEAVAGRLFGPVFALDAARVGRRTSTFVLRWTYLLVLVSVLGVFYSSWRRDLSAPDGVVHPSVLTTFAENFFWVYAVTQFIAVALLTPALTASSITDEKERKTLHFLLVTDLTGREIVFGKLAVRVGLMVMLVLAGLPVIALMQFFGGIEPRLLFLTAGMTLVTVLSLSALGVAASVLMSRNRDATLLAYAIPALYLYVSFQLPNPARAGDWKGVVEAVSAGNPFLIARDIARGAGRDDVPDSAIWYLAFHGLVTVLGFALAAARLRRSVDGSAPAGKPRTAAGRFYGWLIGRRTEARPHPPVTDEPVRWREVYVDPGSGGGLIRRLLIVALLAAIFVPLLGIVYDATLSDSYSYYGYPSRGPAWYFRERIQTWVCWVTGVLGSLMLLRATVRGASSVAGERDRDTWVSLQTTPLTVREILDGKWAGCVWGQRGLMYLLGAVWAVGVVTVSVSPISLALTAAALAAYLYAFAWLGIRVSVTARNARVAIGRAVPTAIFLGGGFWFVLGGCCLGIGLRGSGEGVAHLIGLVAGLTPPFVLTGLPAVDSEFLRDIARYDSSVFLSIFVGGILGVCGWTALGNAWRLSAHAAAATDTNRNSELPPSFSPPPPAPPPEDPPGSSGTAATT